MTKAERIYRDLRVMCENHIKHYGYQTGDKFHHRGFDEYHMCLRTCNAVLVLVDRERKHIAMASRLGVYDDDKKTLRTNTNNMVRSTIEDIRKHLWEESKYYY